MTYFESEQALNRLRWKNPGMFLMAISHLMDVGFRHLTEENIEHTCKQVMEEDDKYRFMTNDFQCALIRMAGELAKFDHIHLLVYVSRNVRYDVGDNKLSYDRMDELLRNCTDYIIANEFKDPVGALIDGCCFEQEDFEALDLENMLSEECDE